MLVPVVDENDVVIGMKERDALAPGDICRVSALWLANSHGEVLIARRALEKKSGPGLWSCAAAGVVDGEETYEENMIRETQEEIGLTLLPEELTPGVKVRRSRIFLQWYFATKDVAITDLSLQKEEVMDARWISVPELQAWIERAPDEFVESYIEFFNSLKVPQEQPAP